MQIEVRFLSITDLLVNLSKINKFLKAQNRSIFVSRTKSNHTAQCPWFTHNCSPVSIVCVNMCLPIPQSTASKGTAGS